MTAGISSGFVMVGRIALAALLVVIATIQVTRADLSGAQAMPGHSQAAERAAQHHRLASRL